MANRVRRYLAVCSNILNFNGLLSVHRLSVRVSASLMSFVSLLPVANVWATEPTVIAPLQTLWRVPENSDLDAYKTFYNSDVAIGEEVCQFYGGFDWHFQSFQSSSLDQRVAPHNDTSVTLVRTKAVRCEEDGTGQVQDIISIWQGLYCPGENSLDYSVAGSAITVHGCPLTKSDKEDNSCPTRNPVYLALGNKALFETDISIDDQLRLRRVYNSRRAESSGAFGTNWRGTWTHTYERRLFDQQSFSVRTVYLYRPNGDLLYFNIDGAEQATPIGLVRGDLTALGGGAWRFTTSDNQQEDYDSEGRLLSISDVRGNTQTLTYDVEGRLAQVVTAQDGSLTFGYDAQSRITTITDHAGRQWGYRYDANDNLEYVDYPDTTTRQYHYEDANLSWALTGITDERGIRYSTYAYNGSGKPILSSLANNVERIDIAYNPATSARTVTNSLGQATIYNTDKNLGAWLITDVTGPGCSSCGASNLINQYDLTNNNLLGKVQNGVTTEYGNYDDKGQYGFKTEAVEMPGERRIDYVYDDRFVNKVETRTEASVYQP